MNDETSSLLMSAAIASLMSAENMALTCSEIFSSSNPPKPRPSKNGVAKAKRAKRKGRK
jgi:hypothetical protein